jgi:hypothetical protein
MPENSVFQIGSKTDIDVVSGSTGQCVNNEHDEFKKDG